ncbi:hypothetical protein F4680DRAFT_452814 [Xylaria scruposa]|nr:hypothetical protein F4680DRAFT_452814 [Xylaria scruposa]
MDPDSIMTLREALSHRKPKPTVLNDTEPGRVLTEDSQFSFHAESITQWVHAENITRWEEFRIDRLVQQFGAVLNSKAPEASVLRQDQELSDIHIRSPTDFARLVQWHDEIIKATLPFAMEKLNLLPGLGVATKVDQDALIYGDGVTTKADHVIMLDRAVPEYLVVGHIRPASMFNATRVFCAPRHINKQEIEALALLASSCKAAKTRYGYILTDRDLVVCRFFKGASERMKTALMRVPWSTSYPHLTTQMALWWLCIIALSGDRQIRREGE